MYYVYVANGEQGPIEFFPLHPVSNSEFYTSLITHLI
jgi:hypothetical protein